MEVWQTSNLRRLRLGEEKKRRRRRRRTNHSMKIYMVFLFHRATINYPTRVLFWGFDLKEVLGCHLRIWTASSFCTSNQDVCHYSVIFLMILHRRPVHIGLHIVIKFSILLSSFTTRHFCMCVLCITSKFNSWLTFQRLRRFCRMSINHAELIRKKAICS